MANQIRTLKTMLARKISIRRAIMLLKAQELGEICNSDIIREIPRITSAVISADIKNMLILKWIAPTSARDPKDGRLIHYKLTKQGHDVVLALTSAS